MLLHPSHILFLMSTMMSIYLMSSSNSWLMCWLALEINLMSIIPLIMKKNKQSSESGLKYFLTQAMASVFLLTFVILSTPSLMYPSMLIMFTLFLKLGAAPLHNWYPSVLEGLSWFQIFLLSTLQKISPLILISFLPKSPLLTFVLFFFIVLSAGLSAVIAFNQNSLRKIMAYSSINHLSWTMSSMQVSNTMWFVYLAMYSTIMYPMTVHLDNSQTFKLNHLFKSHLTMTNSTLMISLLSLGGLPPFSGFIPKILVLKELSTSYISMLLLPLLMSAFMMLFLYFRIIYFFLLNTSGSFLLMNKMMQKTKFNWVSINLLGLLAPPLVVILL